MWKGFEWVLLSFTWFYWVLPSFSGFSLVLPSFTEFFNLMGLDGFMSGFIELYLG